MRNVWVASIVTLFIALIVSGCVSNDERKVSLYEMKDFSEVKEGSLRVVTDPKEIAMWHKAMKDSIQQLGIVDIINPQYKVDLGDGVYYLWSEENAGRVMNVQDSHTIRILTEKYAKEVYLALQSHYHN
ncbi:hypothetical protein [Paenibacillus paeoniae]|uniref:Uncharacterized protein n=1 Tax=Paenibacillus paeoniae TaxID=2292705 RepID=A0A371P7C9_9BACL|nr:hypothetical protein [Paenibacillus paeoniae]REK71829.1 hypothetical protein DX130_19120 [Paenibacillus paeoniae]